MFLMPILCIVWKIVEDRMLSLQFVWSKISQLSVPILCAGAEANVDISKTPTSLSKTLRGCLVILIWASRIHLLGTQEDAAMFQCGI